MTRIGLCFVLSFLLTETCNAFGSSIAKQVHHETRNDDIHRQEDSTRRDVITSFSTTAVLAATTALPLPAFATVSATDPSRTVNLHCLQDLPPTSSSRVVRLYLCRHGQTENNRLRKVQGARVDTDMNENGRKQATNLGKALADVADEPFILAHSPLRRARQTADIVAQQIMTHPKDAPTLLNSLCEIDFGPFAEGQPASNVQQKMMQTYAAWSLGQVDCRPRGGGESGREVLERARHALQELVDLAVSDDESIRNVKHVVAVTHSAFLRVMLGALLDEPLWQAAGAKIYNGSVTVVDVLVTHDSVGGPDQGGTEQRRKAVRFPPSNLDLDQRADPSAIHVVRVNEYRHLPPSTLQ